MGWAVITETAPSTRCIPVIWNCEEYCSSRTVPVPCGDLQRLFGCETGAAFFHLCAERVIFPVAEILHLPLLSEGVEETHELRNSGLIHPRVMPKGKLWV